MRGVYPFAWTGAASMLNCHRAGGTQASSSHEAAADADYVWFDLLDPEPDELQHVERATGLRLPSRERIGSIEMSSRLGLDDDALCMNLPYFADDVAKSATPLGLVVTPKHLISIRYADSTAFERTAAALHEAHKPLGSVDVFVELVGATVAQIADGIENVAATTGTLSMRILAEQQRPTSMLRAVLADVGRLESELTRTRLTMTGLLRAIVFAQDGAPAWFGKAQTARLKIAHKDLDALCELDGQLTDKLQFLLDAVLGFINIDQNDVMKILTVASVASIPPVILVGIWGMNFVNMPELKWPYGYPLALGAIMLSVIVPLLWFRRRGWL